MSKKKDTILLLDAFDEDTLALGNYEARLKEIMKIAWRFRAIVISCRTQFFPSRDEVPTHAGYFKFGGDGGEHSFQKLYISVFDDNDIKKFLKKKYKPTNPINWKRYRLAKSIVRKSPNLMVRPMLLSRIDDLLEDGQPYDYAFEIYNQLIKKWITRESKKPYIKPHFNNPNDFQKQLLLFSKSLSIDLYEHKRAKRRFTLSIKTKLL